MCVICIKKHLKIKKKSNKNVFILDIVVYKRYNKSVGKSTLYDRRAKNEKK
jgi:hypothetical protein